MKTCVKCEESLPLTEFKGNHKTCTGCSGTPTAMAINARNFKWKVAIKECEQGHKYVPIEGRCGVCTPGTPKMVEAKYCEYCKKYLNSLKKKYCGKQCYYAFINRIQGNECKHCDTPMPAYQTKFCSLKCGDDYKANITRLSKFT